MTNAKKVCLGKIVGVHGIRGEVKVKSYTAKDTDIDKYGLVEDKLGKLERYFTPDTEVVVTLSVEKERQKAGEDKVVGKVIGVYNFGAGDVLELRLKESNRQEMIPFSKAYVPEVNIKEGYIIVESVLMNFIDDEEGEAGAEG